jgi:hypothetical protein
LFITGYSKIYGYKIIIDELLSCIACERFVEICCFIRKLILEKVMLSGVKICTLSLYDCLQNLAPNIYWLSVKFSISSLFGWFREIQMEDLGAVKVIIHLSCFADHEYSGIGQLNYLLYVGMS